MFKNERINDTYSGTFPSSYSEKETSNYRRDLLKALYDFMRDKNLRRGHIVIPTGGGKSFTTALACIDNYLPDEVLYVTSKYIILENIFGVDTNKKFGCLKYYKDWSEIMDDNLSVNNMSQSFFLYNTIKNRFDDGTLDEILKGKKIIVFDEDTYSHTDNNFKVLEYISNNYPDIKMLGVGLFDYRPMDGVSLRNFFDYCVYSTNLNDMQRRGILPKINYINAVQSSEVIYDTLKDKINPNTGKKYTLDYCRKLINFNGIGQQNFNLLSDVISRIAVKEHWTDKDRCVHIMSVSPNISSISLHKKKMKELFMDVFNINENDIEFLDYHSYMQGNDRDDSLSRFNRNDGAKFKILCGVSAFSEGLHTDVFVDAMICHRNAKAVYFISQLVGRLEHQCFKRRPYFIDVACDSTSAENNLRKVIGKSTELSDGYNYNNFEDLSIFDFNFDINLDESKSNYFYPQDRMKLISILRSSNGMWCSENLLPKLVLNFPNINELVLQAEIDNLKL